MHTLPNKLFLLKHVRESIRVFLSFRSHIERERERERERDHINRRKSPLISCIETNLQSLGWLGSMLYRGINFHHLGYPSGVDVVNSQIIEWIYNKLQDKLMYLTSQSWAFNVRLDVVQYILKPMLL